MLKGNYYDKYLKYKTKYQQLKQMIEGGAEEHDISDPNDDKNYDLESEDTYSQDWSKLDWESIDERFKKVDLSDEHEKNYKSKMSELVEILIFKHVNISSCNNLFDILNGYLTSCNVRPEEISHYAYIVCIDDKYFLPDVLFISDALVSPDRSDKFFDKLKNNSDDTVKVTIQFFGLSIYFSEQYLEAFKDPVRFLNSTTTTTDVPYLQYMQYIALLKIMSMDHTDKFIRELNDRLLYDYRLYAFLILFNINIINLAKNKIVKQDQIIKLMKICCANNVFTMLVFFCNGVNEGKPLKPTPNYTSGILDVLVDFLNKQINKQISKVKYDSVKTLREAKTKLLQKSVNYFNTHKKHNTSMNKYEFKIVDGDIKDGSELKLSYELSTATS